MQETTVKSIASTSSNVVEFASKIYNKQPIKSGPDFITADTDITDKKSTQYWESDFFKVYCNEKNGKLYRWNANRNNYAFRGFYGYSKNITTCEINNKVESSLIYEWYSSNSTVYPYEVIKTFSNNNYLLSFFDNNKLHGYTSSNSIVTFPEVYISSKNNYNDLYSIIFNYNNNTNKPVEINLFNSYVTINGAKYSLAFDKGRNGQDTVEWLFYSWNNESYGVFVGQEGSKLGKLRFNPGQKLYGEFKFKIPGLTKISAEDMNSFEFFIDGIKSNNFKKMPYYEANKAPTK